MKTSSIQIRDRLRWLAPIVATLATTAALAPPALASSTPTTIAGCNEATSQAFSAWGDLNHYSLAPGGDFENDLTDWTLSDATQVAGSEPYGVTGSLGAASLLISERGRAVSPATCIDPTRETLRLFTRSESADARLRIVVLYVKDGETVKTAKVGTITPQLDWQPSTTLINPVEKVLKSVASDTPTVAYQFTATGGPVQIDDLLIDPRFNR